MGSCSFGDVKVKTLVWWGTIIGIMSTAMGASAIAMYRYRKKLILQEKLRRKREKASRKVNIGAIFGMDVGGTLTKIVYFEKNSAYNRGESPRRESGNDIELTRASSITFDTTKENNVSDDSSECSSSGGMNMTGTGKNMMNSGLKKSKSLSQLDGEEHRAALRQLYEYMDSTETYGSTGMREDRLAVYSKTLGGRLHFLHFETRKMSDAMSLLGAASITENIRSIGCTGGGAHKYAKKFLDELDIQFVQQDELNSLIRGMHYALTNFYGECYTYRFEGDEMMNNQTGHTAFQNTRDTNIQTNTNKSRSKPNIFPSVDEIQRLSGDEVEASSIPSAASSPSTNTSPNSGRASYTGAGGARDVREYTLKTMMPYEDFVSSNPFPYLVVNIGSGVSILKVNAPNDFERVSGSAIGGGTYWGLCRLLTRCTSYENAIDLSEHGNASEIDMLVGDIYGKSYDRLNMSSNMVASSFGKLVMQENPRGRTKDEDIAIALLMMITNNIGQVSYLNAKLHGCSKIFFVGSFLRTNNISCKRLAFAIDFWSKGSMEALFLEHEGYFGALGTFLQSAFGADVDNVLFPNVEKEESIQNGFILDKIDDKIGEMTNKVISGITGNLKNLSPKRDTNKTRSRLLTASRGRAVSADIILNNGSIHFHENVDADGQRDPTNLILNEEECISGAAGGLRRKRSASISEGNFTSSEVDAKHERASNYYQ